MLLLSGCAAASQPVDTCSWVKKIEATEQDYAVASTTLLAQLLVHNTLVAENCP